jgi:hypothetical protein
MGKCISRCRRLLPFLNYMRSFLLLLRRLSFAPPHRPFDFLRRAVFQFIKLVSNAAARVGSSMEMSRFYLVCNYTRTIDTAN